MSDFHRAAFKHSKVYNKAFLKLISRLQLPWQQCLKTWPGAFLLHSFVGKMFWIFVVCATRYAMLRLYFRYANFIHTGINNIFSLFIG